MKAQEYIFRVQKGHIMLCHRNSSKNHQDCRELTEGELEAIALWHLCTKSAAAEGASVILPEDGHEPLLEVNLIY